MIHTLLLDARGKVTWLSHGDELHDAKQIIGRKVWELVPEKERDGVRAALMAAMVDNGKPAREFTSGVVNSAPKYRVTMQHARRCVVVVTVQRLLPANITARERDVLRYIADDWKPTAIAKKLRLSPNTIDSYRRNIRRKLGARGTADLVRWAIRAGLIAP